MGVDLLEVVAAVLRDAASGGAELSESAWSAEPDVDWSGAEEAGAAPQHAVRVLWARSWDLGSGCNDFGGLWVGAHRFRPGRC